MNNLSFALILIGGFLFSLVFEDMCVSWGFKKDFFKQYYSFLLLPFLYLIGFLFFPVIFYGKLMLQTQGFYNSIYFWFAVSLLVGGFVRFIFDKIKKK
jgi:hypothetical protein